MYLFSRLEIVVQGIKSATQRSLCYLSQLQIQLNALSMQKRSPNTIEPKEMKHILKDIDSRLPNKYGLPTSPDTDLCTYLSSLVVKP